MNDDVVVLSSHLSGEAPVRSQSFAVVDATCADPYDYWRALAGLWDGGVTIVNVEHDMEFSDALMDDLLTCPEPICAHAYLIHVHSLQPRDPFHGYNVSSVGWHPPIEPLSQYSARGFRWVEPDDRWADFGSLGFCKIEARARCGPLRRDTWRGVEWSVNAAINARWHLHWPAIDHYHKEDGCPG